MIKRFIANHIIRIAATLYCVGLFLFYLCAAFSIKGASLNISDWCYYWWEKTAGASIIAWLALYLNVGSIERKIVAPVLAFTVIRLIADVVTYFTGIGTNNNFVVAVLFLILVGVFYVLTLRRGNIFDRFLSNILFN